MEGAVSAFATPVPPLKVLYLRLLHQCLIGRCCICVCYTSPSLEGVVSTFASPCRSLKVFYLRLLHHSLIERDLVYVCFSQSFIKRAVSAFTTPVPPLKGLYLRFVHQSLNGGVVSTFASPSHSLTCCVCVCYTIPSLECAVSEFATPLPHWKVLYLRLLLSAIY